MAEFVERVRPSWLFDIDDVNTSSHMSKLPTTPSTSASTAAPSPFGFKGEKGLEVAGCEDLVGAGADSELASDSLTFGVVLPISRTVLSAQRGLPQSPELSFGELPQMELPSMPSMCFGILQRPPPIPRVVDLSALLRVWSGAPAAGWPQSLRTLGRVSPSAPVIAEAVQWRRGALSVEKVRRSCRVFAASTPSAAGAGRAAALVRVDSSEPESASWAALALSTGRASPAARLRVLRALLAAAAQPTDGEAEIEGALRLCPWAEKAFGAAGSTGGPLLAGPGPAGERAVALLQRAVSLVDEQALSSLFATSNDAGTKRVQLCFANALTASAANSCFASSGGRSGLAVSLSSSLDLTPGLLSQCVYVAGPGIEEGEVAEAHVTTKCSPRIFESTSGVSPASKLRGTNFILIDDLNLPNPSEADQFEELMQMKHTRCVFPFPQGDRLRLLAQSLRQSSPMLALPHGPRTSIGGALVVNRDSLLVAALPRRSCAFLQMPVNSSHVASSNSVRVQTAWLAHLAAETRFALVGQARLSPSSRMQPIAPAAFDIVKHGTSAGAQLPINVSTVSSVNAIVLALASSIVVATQFNVTIAPETVDAEIEVLQSETAKILATCNVFESA